MIGVRASQKGIEFQTNFAAGLPAVVNADEIRLRQILVNLLGNAVKFTDVGQVTFLVEPLAYDPTRTEAGLRFTIKDTGSGVPPEEHSRIFQPFHQVLGQSLQHSGTGLGLAISQHLATLMGSTIQVTSLPEQGSTFWFEVDLPVIDDAYVGPDAPPTPKIIAYQGRSRTILVVDDDATNRAVLGKTLSTLGFVIIEANDGLPGLELARQVQPDLIVMDMRMPGMNGQEMTRQLRQMADFSQTPIIAVSASAFEQDKKDYLAAGCDNFLPKPLILFDLLALIQRYLQLEWIYGAELLRRCLEWSSLKRTKGGSSGSTLLTRLMMFRTKG